ncbi:hypothetical protein [Alkalicoccus daliensis]|uniref:Uncharacterized protein n=1 Tax=Alkalicoccus daliensis TaxID=745820 RepID=A0A1H0CIS7_9BACI|nr:hypothetical protein [Alkalicoccus daliensis]SDN57732.1 hypothetical protein SAMN04488053_102116 [Alkalicoccus daliensis]
MKKKMMISALSSMFVLGSLAACGGNDVNDDFDNGENGVNTTEIEEENGVNNNFDDGEDGIETDMENNEG